MEDRLIVNTEYPQELPSKGISVLTKASDEHDTLFSLKNLDAFMIVNDKGEDTCLTEIDGEKTYAYKMSKEITTTQKKDEVRVKLNNDFQKEKVEIKSIEFVSDYHGEDYEYEVWEITTTNAVVYKNIYEVKDGKRELIQTLGLTEGINFTTPGSFSFFVSYNGQPLIQESSVITRKNDTTEEKIAYRFTLYDINYNKIGEFQINNDTVEKIVEDSIVQIGDYTYFQVLEGATEKNHDFYVTEALPDTLYFNVATYKIDNSKATMTEVNCEYLIENAYYDKTNIANWLKGLSSLNSQTATLSVRKITDKQLDIQELVLVNEKLQTKEIDYVKKEITKLSSDRYLVKDSSDNYYLINNSYKIIARLGVIDNFFTTEDSIILTINSTSYVCNYDGVVIKKYNKEDIVNIHNSRYYLVGEKVLQNGVEKTLYYLEQLGYREESVIYEKYQGMTSFNYNDTDYAKQIVDNLNTDTLSVIVRVKEISSTNYTYEFYNYQNEILFSLSNAPNQNMKISVIFIRYLLIISK